MGKQQKYIKSAFIELLKKNSIHNISVNALTKKADVSRSCFYTYYTDKYELLESIEDELIDGFVDIMSSVRSHSAAYFFDGINHKNYPIYEDYFEYIKKNKNMFKLLLSSQSETNFTFKLIKAISITRQETMDLWNLPMTADEFLVFNEELLASSYVTTFKTWIDQDCNPSSKKMGTYLCSLWRPGFFYTEKQYDEALKYQKK